MSETKKWEQSIIRICQGIVDGFSIGIGLWFALRTIEWLL